MKNYIIKRILLIPLTLLGILTVNFCIIQLAPGGPVEYMLAKYQGMNVDSKAQFTATAPAQHSSGMQKYQGAQGVPDDLVEALEKQFGFDKPWHERFLKMIKEYNFLKHKFGLQPSPDCRWRFLRLRPDNFPHIRIAQLACLYHRSQGLLSQLMEAETLKQLRDLLKGGTSEYWLTHYSFGEISPSRPKTLSQNSIDLLIINTVVPFLYTYGKYKSEEKLCLRATNILEELPPENNYITRLWKECGLNAAHAGDSQALIQLKKNYCDTKKCLYCRIGYEYFKRMN